MRIEWAKRAELQFLELLAQIHIENPGAAWRLHRRTIQWTHKLSQFPNSGRAGRMPGTREMFVVGTPFLLVYTVMPEFVSIDFVIHTSQQWPTEE